MILALHKPPFEIGARRIGCVDGDKHWVDQPYVLLREVTLDDWVAYVTPRIPKRDLPAALRACRHDRFFEVSTD